MLKSIHAFFARALLALLLAGASGAVFAAPIYRVTVDTSAWSGSGYLNLTLAGVAHALPITATVSNFTGSFGAASFTQGEVAGDVGSVVTLVQGSSFNELLQEIAFGGLFTFDVGFDLPEGLLDGANFGVALVNADLTAYAAGTDGDIATIALMPGAADALWLDARFAGVAEVPEPGSAAILALGLLLMGWSRLNPRRSSAAGAASL